MKALYIIGGIFVLAAIHGVYVQIKKIRAVREIKRLMNLIGVDRGTLEAISHFNEIERICHEHHVPLPRKLALHDIGWGALISYETAIEHLGFKERTTGPYEQRLMLFQRRLSSMLQQTEDAQNTDEVVTDWMP